MLYFQKFCEQLGISSSLSVTIAISVSIILLILVSWIAYVLTWKIMRRTILPIIQRSKTTFDDILVKHRFFKRLAFFVPAILLYYFLDDAIGDAYKVPAIILDFIDVWLVIISIMIIESVLSTIRDYYQRYEISKERPIDSFVQVIKIISYIVGGLVVISIFIDKDISTLLLSLGTMSAVLMLIFRDPILGFIGGLQLTFNEMVRIGDWISVPKYDADGVVLEITLTVVKVQNWDKTISMVPTYALVSNSFQNWRGMEESGGRRIKRSINIDMDSVKFCTPEMLVSYRKIQILQPYLDKKEKEIENYNKKNKIDPSVFVNGRRQTNLGVFRAYLKAYLKLREDINQNMTFLVRHLQPTEKGLPIEVYVFTKTTEWADYENVQADIFDHILAAIPQFGLKVYQYPSNSGIVELLKKKSL
ncbi:MAG: mechanosensitive ion channel family protein [Bacteroidetes bacterium]|nr:MAG: mechanosensitive ion channel family protein [Bacteroidota bacterium]